MYIVSSWASTSSAVALVKGKKRSIEAAQGGTQCSMGLSFLPDLPCVVETCSEDTIIEHKKLPPDDLFNNTIFRPQLPVPVLISYSLTVTLLNLTATITLETTSGFLKAVA